jgi:dihydroxyacetone kinase-like predicted kinase
MPEALAALVAYDADASAADNAREMTGAAASVVTGEVTRAVRDSTSAAGTIVEGDWLGLVRGEGIVAVAPSVERAAMALLDVIVGDSAELVTVVTGADAERTITDQIVGWLGDHRGDIQVDMHHGGQPLYPYLFGVE